jgi:hypothetical protein
MPSGVTRILLLQKTGAGVAMAASLHACYPFSRHAVVMRVMIRYMSWLSVNSGRRRRPSLRASQDYISHVNLNISARGNCSYTEGALARLAYDKRCRSVEQEDGLSGMMQVRSVCHYREKGRVQCLSAACMHVVRRL